MPVSTNNSTLTWKRRLSNVNQKSGTFFWDMVH